MPSEFERVVRDAMDQRDLSLAALARESGVDRGRWYAWFRGAHIPKARTLTGPAHALGLTVDDLLAPFGGITEKPGTVMVPGLSDLLEALVDQTSSINALAAQIERLADAHSPAATAHLVADAVSGALRVVLPDVLRAAGLHRE